MGEPARGASLPESGSGRRGAGLRLLAAIVWMAVAKLLGLWFSELPVLSLLGTTSVAFVGAGALFGWPGIVAAMGVQIVFLDLVQGLVGTYPWASTASYGAAAALAWATFRYVPRVGRGLPDLRSLTWFAIAAGVGALLSSTVIALTGHQGHVLEQVAVWSRSTAVSLWVFAPALLVLGDRRLRRLLAPIPGEVRTRPAQRVALVREGAPGAELQVIDLEASEERFGRLTWVCLLMVLAITVVRAAVHAEWAHGVLWLNVLYFGPVWWMAQRLRLPGALVAVSLVGFGLLGGYAAFGLHEEISQPVALSLYGQLLSFWLVGILLARGAEREGRLLDGVTDLHRRLEQDMHRLVAALTGAVEAKDAYTGGHLQRVNAFALEVGRRLGLGARDLELLQIAGTLHDIGKIGIPESILNKPGPLDSAEWEVMHRHPEIGARLLLRVEGLREAAPLVLHHQERWDGRTDVTFPGYPQGIAGDAIPLGARIIAVVDAFDAMITDRSYRAAKSVEQARSVLLGERGAQFDPGVVDVFLRLLDEQPWDSQPRAPSAS
jgi:HD-GYP domain-containing protein (c-di-GMP phosphodiesterase class II)